MKEKETWQILYAEISVRLHKLYNEDVFVYHDFLHRMYKFLIYIIYYKFTYVYKFFIRISNKENRNAIE